MLLISTVIGKLIQIILNITYDYNRKINILVLKTCGKKCCKKTKL